MIVAKEIAFSEQRYRFIELAMKSLGWESLGQARDPAEISPQPVEPVVIKDFRELTGEEKNGIAAQYYGQNGVAHYVVLNPGAIPLSSHPLLDIASQIKDLIPTRHPVAHPLEGHPEAVARFGNPDGTLKIYDLDTKRPEKGYREQAETSEMFDAHNDGLGYAGAVEVFALHADSASIWGGYTYFQNIVRISLHLALTDPEAFASLFLPDAITALRPRGKGAIEVTSPVLFIGEFEQPQVFFRLATGEYKMIWRQGVPALERARAFLTRHSLPFSQGSAFIHLDRPGAGCFARNQWVVHGRTPFINGPERNQTRVLARKWFMSSNRHTNYKHVPGMHILLKYAQIFPERFGEDRLYGHWNYDPAKSCNVRKS